MRQEHFSKEAPGELIVDFQDPEKRKCFVPRSLYPDTSLTVQMRQLITAVTRDLGRIDGMATLLPDPAILIRSFVRREAQISSYIENTFANYDEVAAADRPKEGGNVSAQAKETWNAERAILAGIEAVNQRKQPVTNALIRQLHEILLSDVRGHPCRGAFRKKQVYIGNELLGPAAARFVPPAGHSVQDLMEQFEKSWHEGKEYFPLVRIAMLHYQFETIHPFEDGNGRLGRILTLLALCDFGLLNTPMLNASLYFERNRQEYYDGLLRVSTHGDWAGWITFFMEGLRVAAVESIQKMEELFSLQARYHAMIRASRNSARLLTLVDHLFISPTITINEAAHVMGITHAAASQSIQKLLDARVLRIRKPGKPTIFVADTILKAVNAEPTRR